MKIFAAGTGSPARPRPGGGAAAPPPAPARRRRRPLGSRSGSPGLLVPTKCFGGAAVSFSPPPPHLRQAPAVRVPPSPEGAAVERARAVARGAAVGRGQPLRRAAVGGGGAVEAGRAEPYAAAVVPRRPGEPHFPGDGAGRAAMPPA